MLYKTTQEAKFDEVVTTHMGVIRLRYSQRQTKVGKPLFLGFLVSFLYFFPLCEQQSEALDENSCRFLGRIDWSNHTQSKTHNA